VRLLLKLAAAVPAPETNASLCVVKGAPERLLPLCTNVDAVMCLRLEHAVEQLASQGLRVLDLIHTFLSFTYLLSHNFLIFLSFLCITHYIIIIVGLAALRDPSKGDSFGAVAECQQAGITVRMLTGDHKVTEALARELGILSTEVIVAAGMSSSEHTGAAAAALSQLVMAGPQLDAMTEEALDALPELPIVVARASPESKVKIVEALHRQRRVVAMTGDGVNDSPALRTANVGVAMGITGSDVTKGVADLVLADDNFATIVSAVREGRRIFDSVFHFLLHLLSGNVAEAVTLMLSLAFVVDDAGKPVFVLSPLAILYINTATGSPPAIGLALDKPAPDLMTRPSIRHGLYTREQTVDFFVYGVVMGGLTLAAFCAVM
jgi:potassium/sodium efflux P-type ATPase